MGFFQHCGLSAYCILTLNKFISRGATHHTDARDPYQLLPMNFASKSVIHENPLGSFTYRKAGTWDISFYFPSEGRHTEDFPDARKIQRFRPGLCTMGIMRYSCKRSFLSYFKQFEYHDSFY